jgi:hypothetical protein
MSLLALTLLALVAVGIAVRRRRSPRRAGTAFRCRLRARSRTGTAWRRLTRRWSRPMWAMWVGDELVVRRGPVFDREIVLRARVTSAGVYVPARGRARWWGHHPIAVGLTVSDGSWVEVAADEEARMALVGPYLAAAVNDLPRAPVPRRQRSHPDRTAGPD